MCFCYLRINLFNYREQFHVNGAHATAQAQTDHLQTLSGEPALPTKCLHQESDVLGHILAP